jgi:pilus assembly protein CpaC
MAWTRKISLVPAALFSGFLLALMIPVGAMSIQTPATPVPAEQPPSQELAPQAAPLPPLVPSKPATQLAPRTLTVQVGRGELLQFADSASRVSVSEPLIADAVVISTHEVVVNGKSAGNTTVMVWHGESVSRYEVTVQPDLNEIQQELRATLPSERIQVSSSKDAILLTGVVTSPEVARRAAEIASIHAKTVVNLLQAPPAENRQVMLQVKFASVDRTALSNFAVNMFSPNSTLNGTATTQQFPFPQMGQLQLSPVPGGEPRLGSQTVNISNLLNLFVFRPDLNLGATIAALQQRNLLEILAEPDLVTISGQEASFLAGGEFPFPVLTTTGSTGTAAPVITIQFREFGVRLSFTPTVDTNEMIHLKVKPEVSSLDFSNAVQIGGFFIPAISTRRAETQVDLREGESFAIAGLLDNRVTQVLSKVPVLGNVPVLGQLFRSRQTNKVNTELLVVITPRFVKPFAEGETVPMPNFPMPLLDGPRAEPAPAPPKFVGPRGHESPGEPK